MEALVILNYHYSSDIFLICLHHCCLESVCLLQLETYQVSYISFIPSATHLTWSHTDHIHFDHCSNILVACSRWTSHPTLLTACQASLSISKFNTSFFGIDVKWDLQLLVNWKLKHSSYLWPYADVTWQYLNSIFTFCWICLRSPMDNLRGSTNSPSTEHSKFIAQLDSGHSCILLARFVFFMSLITFLQGCVSSSGVAGCWRHLQCFALSNCFRILALLKLVHTKTTKITSTRWIKGYGHLANFSFIKWWLWCS